MYVLHNGIRYEINEQVHYITVIDGKQMVLCHDDGCQAPLVNGYCEHCGFRPDTQSRQFSPIIIERPTSLVDVLLEKI